MDQILVNPIMGKRVEFSFTNAEDNEGIVIDKITMTNSSKDLTPVTGYLIQCDSGELKVIQCWRLKRVLPDEDEMPKGHIAGGFITRGLSESGIG